MVDVVSQMDLLSVLKGRQSKRGEKKERERRRRMEKGWVCSRRKDVGGVMADTILSVVDPAETEDEKDLCLFQLSTCPCFASLTSDIHILESTRRNATLLSKKLGWDDLERYLSSFQLLVPTKELMWRLLLRRYDLFVEGMGTASDEIRDMLHWSRNSDETNVNGKKGLLDEVTDLFVSTSPFPLLNLLKGSPLFDSLPTEVALAICKEVVEDGWHTALSLISDPKERELLGEDLECVIGSSIRERFLPGRHSDNTNTVKSLRRMRSRVYTLEKMLGRPASGLNPVPWRSLNTVVVAERSLFRPILLSLNERSGNHGLSVGAVYVNEYADLHRVMHRDVVLCDPDCFLHLRGCFLAKRVILHQSALTKISRRYHLMSGPKGCQKCLIVRHDCPYPKKTSHPFQECGNMMLDGSDADILGFEDWRGPKVTDLPSCCIVV